jgi:hypothetical protein
MYYYRLQMNWVFLKKRIIVGYRCYHCYKKERARAHTHSLTIKVKIQLENCQFYNVHPTQLPLQFALGNLSLMVMRVVGEADHFHHPECAVPHHITYPWHRAEAQRQTYLAFYNTI